MELGWKVKGYGALRACSWFILDSADVLKEVNGCMYEIEECQPRPTKQVQRQTRRFVDRCAYAEGRGRGLRMRYSVQPEAILIYKPRRDRQYPESLDGSTDQADHTVIRIVKNM
ncbi:hypothetical protein H109_04173 [Trichophyton interdigitale MR816]|uniref:Uncharacterized protein n=1 Tax=Trichophyton interdigitale (strain MR816) TaxID=1215338 RepID=A0A059J7S2_TRIIM|nr:hypothetical protein H101_07024 [Trichophyton interdigitale H6]KDB23931.1 hypothetical protein H109_04173 [Trichophyton interdigitale MR816]